MNNRKDTERRPRLSELPRRAWILEKPDIERVQACTRSMSGFSSIQARRGSSDRRGRRSVSFLLFIHSFALCRLCGFLLRKYIFEDSSW